MPTDQKAKKPARYAEGTTIPVAQSRQDIEQLLGKHGAKQAISGSDFETRAGFVGFTLGKRQIRFKLQPYKPRERGSGAQQQPEQYERESWRTLLLVIKAKLEAVRSGVVTVEQEFLANIVLPNGKLLGEEVAPAVEEMYETGQVRSLLPEYETGARQLGAG